MNIISVVLIAFGLSMDAFAVSVANGADSKFDKIFFSAVVFGLFQGIQPVIGWAAGINIQSYIIETDHWIAFSLLVFVGGKMMYEAYKPKNSNSEGNFRNSIYCILMLGIATSIDALIVGFSFSFLQLSIMRPALLIGIITFFMCLAGGGLGRKFGSYFGKKFEFIGGVILFLMGMKILIEHLAG